MQAGPSLKRAGVAPIIVTDLTGGWGVKAVALALLAAMGMLLFASFPANWALQQSFSDSPPAPLLIWLAHVDVWQLPLLAAMVATYAWATRSGSFHPPVSVRTGGWILGVGLALALCVGLAFRPVDAPVLLLLLLASLAVGSLLANTSERWLLPLLAGAFAVRTVVTLVMGMTGIITTVGIALLDDEAATDRAALNLAQILVRQQTVLQPDWRHLLGPYLDLLAAWYALVGQDFTTVRLLNVAIGTVTVGLIYGLTRRLAGRRAAGAAGLLTAFWPMLVVWGGSGVRDPLSMLLLILPAWLFARRLPRGNRVFLALRLATVALCLLELWSLRPPAAFALAGGLAAALLGVLARHLGWRRAVALMGAGAAAGGVACVGLVLRGVLPLDTVKQLTPRAIEYRIAVAELQPLVEQQGIRLPRTPGEHGTWEQQGLGEIVRAVPPGHTSLMTGITAAHNDATSQFHVIFSDGQSADLTTDQFALLSDNNIGWMDVLGHVRDAAAALFIPPLPGSVHRLRELLGTPDTLVWDALLVLAIAGAWRSRSLRPAWLAVTGHAVPLLFGLAVASSNSGTAARQRTLLLAAMIVLAAPVVVEGAQRLRTWTWTWTWSAFPFQPPWDRRSARPGDAPAPAPAPAPANAPSRLR